MTTFPTPRVPWREDLIPWTALAACWTSGWRGAGTVALVACFAMIHHYLSLREHRAMLLDAYLKAPPGTEVVLGARGMRSELRIVLGNGRRQPATTVSMGPQARSVHRVEQKDVA